MTPQGSKKCEAKRCKHLMSARLKTSQTGLRRNYRLGNAAQWRPARMGSASMLSIDRRPAIRAGVYPSRQRSHWQAPAPAAACFRQWSRRYFSASGECGPSDNHKNYSVRRGHWRSRSRPSGGLPVRIEKKHQARSQSSSWQRRARRAQSPRI